MDSPLLGYSLPAGRHTTALIRGQVGASPWTTGHLTKDSFSGCLSARTTRRKCPGQHTRSQAPLWPWLCEFNKSVATAVEAASAQLPGSRVCLLTSAPLSTRTDLSCTNGSCWQLLGVRGQESGSHWAGLPRGNCL